MEFINSVVFHSLQVKALVASLPANPVVQGVPLETTSPAGAIVLKLPLASRSETVDTGKSDYKNNRDEHNINVKAGHNKPNGDHWSVDYTHDMGGKH